MGRGGVPWDMDSRVSGCVCGLDRRGVVHAWAVAFTATDALLAGSGVNLVDRWGGEGGGG